MIRCEACGEEIYSYNSCGDRHCPQCQNIKKELWIDKLVHHLLPIRHFHIIFTIPHELNDLFYYNQQQCYSLLFQVAAETIQQIVGKNNKTGMVGVLHTWGSNLSYHPHLHCIVPNGYFDGEKWKSGSCNNGRFFCYAADLRSAFKELFIQRLVALIENEELYYKSGYIDKERALFMAVKKVVKKINRKKWCVRIENPMLGVEQVITYLGRYIHRIAISNYRIKAITKDKVTFTYKQYAKQQKGKAAPEGTMSMNGAAFLQRFCQHILPTRFQRIRYYGIYNFSQKKLKNRVYQLITEEEVIPYEKPSTKDIVEKILGYSPDICSFCGVVGELVTEKLPTIPSQLFKLRTTYNLPPIRAGPGRKLGQLALFL